MSRDDPLRLECHRLLLDRLHLRSICPLARLPVGRAVDTSSQPGIDMGRGTASYLIRCRLDLLETWTFDSNIRYAQAGRSRRPESAHRIGQKQNTASASVAATLAMAATQTPTRRLSSKCLTGVTRLKSVRCRKMQNPYISCIDQYAQVA